MKKNIYILILFLLCLMGGVLVLPYVLSLQNKSIGGPISFNLFLIIVQNLILYGIAVPAGFYFSRKININLILLESKSNIRNHFAKNIKYIIGFGLFSFLFIFLSDLFIFKSPLDIKINPFFGFLASFYGGINEEVINRLFLTSLIAFLLIKISKNKSISMWISILITSIMFGLLHLFATAVLTPLTPLIILRAILLNGVPGIIFGWLYWKKSFEVAVLTHFFVDICLHVLLPLMK